MLFFKKNSLIQLSFFGLGNKLNIEYLLILIRMPYKQDMLHKDQL